MEVKFSSFSFHFYITVSKYVDGKLISKESALPLQDHFSESKIIYCIEWAISEINKTKT